MVRTSVLGCLMVALGATSLAAQETACERPVEVSGAVSTATGDPLPDAAVTIPGAQLRLVTDASGRFTIPPLCPGRYRIRFSHLGYATVDGPYELSAGTRLAVELAGQAVELEGMLVEVASVMIRLERRRTAHGSRSAVFDWRDFTKQSLPSNIPEWVARRAGVRIVDCGGAYWGTRDCFQDRHGVQQVEVCVDETPSVSTVTIMGRYPREEIGRAEFYRLEGLMKIYTKEFLARASLSPWMIRTQATQC